MSHSAQSKAHGASSLGGVQVPFSIIIWVQHETQGVEECI